MTLASARRIVTRTAAIGVALCLAAVSCRDPMSPAEAIIVTAPGGSRMMKYAASSTLSLSIENRSNEIQYLEYSSCEALFEVLDRNTGEVVAPDARVCTASAQQVKVPAHGTVTTTTTWAGDALRLPCSGAPGCNPTATYYLEVGFYLLRPRVRVVGAGWVYGPTELLAIYP